MDNQLSPVSLSPASKCAPSPQTIIATPQTLARLSGVPASFRLTGMFVLRARRGRIVFTLPDERQLVFDHNEAGPIAAITVHNLEFARKALAGGDVGFAESYMDGDWSTPDLTAVLTFFSENFEAAGQLAVGGKMVRFVNRIRHVFNRNSKSGSKRNITAHYDLGNAFYERWLDPSMTYSSALYTRPDLSLEAAQREKYKRIADRLQLTEGQHILEIGCGWGGFAEYAAKERGVHVTGLTLSPSQKAYAEERLAKQGLSSQVSFRLEDYRDHKGVYDGVASIEMFEAVGESYWPSYFDKVHDCLKNGARAALQIITISDELFPRYRKRADFIQRYIFPGGMLPGETALQAEFERAGLRLNDTFYFGPDYAKTLRLWAKDFEQNWPDIMTHGFDERFRRLWHFYLSYCEAGFDNGRINVGQFELEKV